MRDLTDNATKNGIELIKEGDCQFCGAKASHGVFECYENVHHLSEILDFSNPLYYLTRFLSVDAMSLQHCEIYGLANNHIHLTRIHLVFEKNITWDYSKTPLLKEIINQYKKNTTELLTPPPFKKRGNLTTINLIKAGSPRECEFTVRQWAKEVYNSYKQYHTLVSSIAGVYLDKYGNI